MMVGAITLQVNSTSACFPPVELSATVVPEDKAVYKWMRVYKSARVSTGRKTSSGMYRSFFGSVTARAATPAMMFCSFG